MISQAGFMTVVSSSWKSVEWISLITAAAIMRPNRTSMRKSGQLMYVLWSVGWIPLTKLVGEWYNSVDMSVRLFMLDWLWY